MKIVAARYSRAEQPVLIVTGLGSTAIMALGSDLIVPLGEGIGSLCVLVGITSTIMFCGLMDVNNCFNSHS